MDVRNGKRYQVLRRQRATVDELCAEYYQQLQHMSQVTKRQMPAVPERVLDAPAIVDDFYLNVLDWGVRGELAVALGGTVYLWSEGGEGGGSVRELASLESGCVTSLSFIHDGSCLALGADGQIQIWDVQEGKRVRTMLPEGKGRVAALSWNKHLLSGGCRDGHISTHDVRVKHSVWAVPGGVNSGEVCGLKWSWDGRQLASGSNDNLVSVFSADGKRQFVFDAHSAAVKALAWCPWQAGILASGGGSADRQVLMHCTLSGRLLSSIDTGSQISSILWSRTSKEFVTAHGFADNALKVFTYAEGREAGRIGMAHDQRILHAAISPCGQVVCTAGADESIKFWRLFQQEASEDDVGKRILIPKLMPTFAKNKRIGTALTDGKKTMFLKKK